MPVPVTIRMTLTGPFKGVTKTFGKYDFNKGICLFTGTQEHCDNVSKYFTRSYQVKTDVVTAESIVAEAKAAQKAKQEAKPEAIRVDDSDVATNEEIEDAQAAPEEPNARQADIIAAVNLIDKDKWVDQHAKTPRPKVKDVSEAMDDPTVNKKEIVEVIQRWLS